VVVFLASSLLVPLALLSAQGNPLGDRSERLSVLIDPESSACEVAFVEQQPPSPFLRLAVWSVPVDAPAEAVRVSGRVTDPRDPVFGPGSERIFFTSGGNDRDLYEAPADGSHSPLFLGLGFHSYTESLATWIGVSPNDKFAFFSWGAAYPAYDFGTVLGRVETSGPGMFLGALVDPRFTSDSAWLVARRPYPLDHSEIRFVDLSTMQVESPLPGSAVSDIHILAPGPDSQAVVVLVGDGGSTFGSDLVRLLAGGLGSTVLDTDVTASWVTPDEESVVYWKGSEARLCRVSTDGTSAPVEIGGPVPIGEETYDPISETLAVSPDGTRVAWIGRERLQFSHKAVFTVPIAGGEPVPVGQLPESPNVAEDFLAFSPDGTRVVFARYGSFAEPRVLVSAPADGSGPPVLLASTAGGNRYRTPGRFLPDSSALVVRIDPPSDSGNHDKLYRLSLDGSQAPRRVSGRVRSAGPGVDVLDTFWIDAAGAWAYYLTDAEGDQGTQLDRHPLAYPPRARRR